MANLTITAANVVPVTGYGFSDMIAGEAVTRGQPVYENAADSDKAYVADANTLAKITVKGIALNDAAASQPVRVLISGSLGFGAILTVGKIYCNSATAGSICPSADLTTGDYVSILGVATTTGNLKVQILNSSALIPA
jgi:hypothetical protein